MSVINLQVSSSGDDARNANGDGTYNSSVQTQHLGKFSPTVSYWNGFRFNNVTIPQGATINSAEVTLYSAGVTAGTTASTTWYGNDVDDAAAFANNTANKPEGKTRTTASVNKDFTVSNWESVGFNTGDKIDVTTIVQEIVDRGGWSSGNDLTLIAGDNSSADSNYIGISTYDRDPGRGAQLDIDFTSGTEPDAPSGFTATQSGAQINLSWTDNADDEENFRIERRRGNSPNWYLVSSPAEDATSASDTDVDSGYTYYYRIRAEHATNGNSTWVNAASSVTMTGTKSWTSEVMAWVYPGSPAENADEEYSDGRILHVLKPEYYTVNASGGLDQLTDPANGENAYSISNAEDIKTYSRDQFFTISANGTNTATLVNSPSNRSAAISTITSFLTTTGFTGVELDWEGFSGWSSTTWSNYKVFLADLTTACHAINKKTMVDGPPITNETEQGYYEWTYSELDAMDVDYICMMLYDYQYDYGGGSSIQPLSWMRDGIARLKGDITDHSRIVIGTNSYGYHAATGGFSVTIDTKAQSDDFPGYGTATQNADFENEWTNAGIYYNYQDTASMNAKREAIEDEGVQHISVWHLGGNDWYDAYDEIPITPPGIALVSDTFNRADQTDLGSSDGSGTYDPFDWGSSLNINIVSNQAEFQGFTALLFPQSYGDGTGLKDGIMQMEMYPSTSNTMALIARLQVSSNDGYWVAATESGGNMTLSLATVVGAAPDVELWNSSPTTYPVGSLVGIRVQGNEFRVLVNGVDVSGPQTDSTTSVAGEWGPFGDDGDVMDNIAAYQLNNTPVATPQSIGVQKNIPKEITLTGTDADSESLTFTIESLPSNGDLSIPGALLSTDTFNRANGNVGSTDGSGTLDPIAWIDPDTQSESSKFQIETNQAICNDGGGAQLILAGTAVSAFDISADIILDTDSIAGFLLRLGSGGYLATANETTGEISFSANLGSTPIYTSSGASFVSGDTLRVVGIGTSFSIYKNDTLITDSITSSHHASGGVGITAEDDCGIDNFSLTRPDVPIDSIDTELSSPTVKYTPDTAYTGSDSFTFSANDGIEDSGNATISINVSQSESSANLFLGNSF